MLDDTTDFEILKGRNSFPLKLKNGLQLHPNPEVIFISVPHFRIAGELAIFGVGLDRVDLAGDCRDRRSKCDRLECGKVAASVGLSSGRGDFWQTGGTVGIIAIFVSYSLSWRVADGLVSVVFNRGGLVARMFRQFLVLPIGFIIVVARSKWFQKLEKWVMRD
ncbi:MAG: hypothetical protein ACP5D7_04800 [Limnospira sp.]